MKGFIALLWKETAALTPHWIGMVGLILILTTQQFFSSDLTFAEASSRVSGSGGAVMLVFLLAFVCGHGALGPEFRDDHIEFLDTLPTHRATIYAAKVLAALAPSLFTLALSFSLDVCTSLLSPGPIGASPIGPMAMGYGVMIVGVVGGLGCGLLASWVGGLGWGLLIVGVFVGAVFGEIFPILRPYMLVGGFGELRFVSRSVHHPWGPLAFWTLVGVFGIGVSGLLFLGPGAAFTRRGSLLTGGVRIASLGCVGVLVCGVGGLSLLGLLGQVGSLLRPIDVVQVGPLRVLVHTENLADLEPTVRDVDVLSAEVGAAMGQHEPLVMDLEFLGAQDNHLGLFTGGKIRLQHNADRKTVAHELAHAHAFVVSGAGAIHQADHARFFSEGLAEWVAKRVVGGDPIPPIAGAIHAADPVEFEMMVEDEAWTAERDLVATYPLGEVFVEALDQVAGPESRSCVLQGIGEQGRTPIAGLALWVTLGQRCGFELEAVTDRFEALLVEAAPATLPSLDSYVSDQAVFVQASEGAKVVCRIRRAEDGDATNYAHIWANEEGRCPIPASFLSGSTFQYQVGFMFETSVVYERWIEAPTR